MDPDVQGLVGLLSEKDDKIRYGAFLELQERSQASAAVFPFWETFREKLKSDNSYQRSIGLLLIAENAKWDQEGRMAETIDDYLAHLHDDKPITIRQCIQGLNKIITRSPELSLLIRERLLAFDLSEIRETMRKSILLDILHVLSEIRKAQPSDELEAYILWALSGEILDKKSKKEVGSFV